MVDPKRKKTSVKKDEDSDFNVRDYLQLSFELINTKLLSIDEKATKTEASVQGVIRTINQMQVIDAGHFANCPNTTSLLELDKKLDKEIQNLDQRISEFEFFKKYWKLFAIAGALFVCGLIITGYMTISSFEKEIKSKTNQHESIPPKKLSEPSNSTADSYIVH